MNTHINILFCFYILTAVCQGTILEENGKNSENVFYKHGVSVYNSGPVRKVSILYSVVITLNKPILPDLTKWYSEFKSALNSEKSQFIPIKEKQILLSRLNRLAKHNRIFHYANENKPRRDPDFQLRTFYPTFETVETMPLSTTTTVAPKQSSRQIVGQVSDHPDAYQNDSPFQGSGEETFPLRARREVNYEPLHDEFLLQYSNISYKHTKSNFSNIKTLPEIQKISNSTSKSRKKRGLINGVGKLFKILFGISTISDLEHIKNAILMMQKNDMTLRHNQDQLVSTFNLTKVRITRLSEEMSILQKNSGYIQQYLQNQTPIINGLIKKINNLEFLRILDTNLEKMTELINDYNIALQIYNQAKNSLYRGVLTEQLLPQNILQEILGKIANLRYDIEPTTWYYKYLKVQPVNIDTNLVAFETIIPGCSRASFSHFKFETFPVVYGNFTRLISTHKDFAYDSMTNEFFYPRQESCLGQNPLICHENVIFFGSCCNSNLLLGRTDACNLKIEKLVDRSIQIFHKNGDLHNVVIFSPDEVELILKCENSAPPKIITVYNLYKTKLDEKCSIIDPKNNFKISSVQTMQTRYHFEFFTEIKIPSLDFDLPLPEKLIQAPIFKENTQITVPIDEIPDIKLEEIKEIDFFKDNSSNLFFVIIIAVLVTIVLVITIYGSIKLYGFSMVVQKFRACFCMFCKQKTIKSTLDKSDLTSQQTNNDTEAPKNVAEFGKIIYDQFLSQNNTNKEREAIPSAPKIYPIPNIKVDHV